VFRGEAIALFARQLVFRGEAIALFARQLVFRGEAIALLTRQLLFRGATSEFIPFHENLDTHRFLVGAWHCHAPTNVFVSLLK